MDIKDLIQSAYGSAKQIVLRNEQAMTVFLAEWGDGQVAIYMTPWRDDNEKQTALKSLRMMFAAREVTRYVMVTEAWVARQTTYDPRPGDEDFVRPSERDDREERLFLLGVEPGSVIAAYATLGLDDDDNRTCGDLVWAEDATAFEGPMTRLLPDPRLPRPPKDIAERLEKLFDFKPTILH